MVSSIHKTFELGSIGSSNIDRAASFRLLLKLWWTKVHWTQRQTPHLMHATLHLIQAPLVTPMASPTRFSPPIAENASYLDVNKRKTCLEALRSQPPMQAELSLHSHVLLPARASAARSIIGMEPIWSLAVVGEADMNN